MSTEAVRAALEGRLAAWASARSPALRIAYQNVPFTPNGGETYLRPVLLPAPTISDDLAGAHRGYVGVLQVSIVGPPNIGMGAALGIAAELDALFPVNGRYTASGVTTQVIGPASAGPVIQEPDQFNLPVSIQYRADTL